MPIIMIYEHMIVTSLLQYDLNIAIFEFIDNIFNNIS